MTRINGETHFDIDDVQNAFDTLAMYCMDRGCEECELKFDCQHLFKIMPEQWEITDGNKNN